MTDPRLVNASRADDDAQYETGLRPRTLRDYIGQERVRENLAEEAKVSSKLILADFAAWRAATEAYVSEHNAMIKNNADGSLKSKLQ